MTLSLILIFMSVIAFSLPMAINPLTMGIIILLISLVLALTFSLSMSSWVAFLIFLIYIGGMLVIFAYFVAIIPNQTVSIINILFFMGLSFVIIGVIRWLIGVMPAINYIYGHQINIFYLQVNVFILFILAIILLFTIIVVVKITINTKGPLRPFDYV